MARVERQEILARLRAKIDNGRPIIGGGAGTGLSAKCEEAGGIDLMVIYNSGRYRMAGRGSIAGYMAYGNANEIVMDMAGEVLPVVKHTPVLAGVNATDPFIIIDVFLEDLKRIGFSGVQNFPTMGIIDGNFRQSLEETGMSYSMEVEMIEKARKLDLLTTPYVFNKNEAIAMANAGADILVAHFGVTTGGAIGAESSKTLRNCASLFNDWVSAVKAIRPDLLFICHGGPVSEPADAKFMLENCPDCHGFYGASSMERLPTEIAIRQRTEQFQKLSLT